MPSRYSLQNTLFDIRDNIFLARKFVEGLTLESFTDSRLRFYATTRALEIVPEACRRLPGTLRAKHNHLPWRQIEDAGNHYRHAYDNVGEAIVWDTVHVHLPPLLEVIGAEIKALEH